MNIGPYAILFEDRRLPFELGETLAAVLLADGLATLNNAPDGSGRGLYCNMGICMDCEVMVTSTPNGASRRLRACMVEARDGMVVERLVTVVNQTK